MRGRLRLVQFLLRKQVQYCFCDGRCSNPEDLDYAKQLFDVGLWPVSLKSPQTVITFSLIENFIHHNDADKKSPYSFCLALRAMTDAVDPTAWPVSRWQQWRPACNMSVCLCILLGRLPDIDSRSAHLAYASSKSTQWPTFRYRREDYYSPTRYHFSFLPRMC